MTEFDLVGHIIEYETGQLTEEAVLKLFAELIKTGKAWSLQGHYGRTATHLINEGWIDENGTILKGLPL